MKTKNTPDKHEQTPKHIVRRQKKEFYLSWGFLPLNLPLLGVRRARRGVEKAKWVVKEV